MSWWCLWWCVSECLGCVAAGVWGEGVCLRVKSVVGVVCGNMVSRCGRSHSQRTAPTRVYFLIRSSAHSPALPPAPTHPSSCTRPHLDDIGSKSSLWSNSVSNMHASSPRERHCLSLTGGVGDVGEEKYGEVLRVRCRNLKGRSARRHTDTRKGYRNSYRGNVNTEQQSLPRLLYHMHSLSHWPQIS